MTKQTHRAVTTGDDAIDSIDHLQQVEPDQRIRMQTMTPAALAPNMSAPKSETGLAEVIGSAKEGGEDNSVQDAPRAIGEAQAAAAPKRKPIILLIEDTMELAEVIQAALSRASLETVHESHGGKALSRYADHKPDLILLDIGLPDISGWQFLEGIKERHKADGTPLPPVIVITAFGDPANRLVGKFQGVHDYLIKPFTAAEVENVVTKALASRSE